MTIEPLRPSIPEYAIGDRVPINKHNIDDLAFLPRGLVMNVYECPSTMGKIIKVWGSTQGKAQCLRCAYTQNVPGPLPSA